VTTPWIVAFGVLWGTVLLTVVIVLGLLRRLSGVLERLEAAKNVNDLELGAPVMSTVPQFDLFESSGQRISYSEIIRGPTIVLFMSADCPACDVLAKQLVDVGQEVDDLPFVLVMEDAPAAWSPAMHSRLRVLYQRGEAATNAFANRATPQAYVVDEAGIVLDRRVPGSFADLRAMALRQRKGGAISQTLELESAVRL
jgi:thiol-disulfide isomerase/thioredoxin